MSQDRPTLFWKLAVAAGIAAGLLGIVSLVYAFFLERTLVEEELPIPEHVDWMNWAGVLLLLLGGLLALALLLQRFLRVARGHEA